MSSYEFELEDQTPYKKKRKKKQSKKSDHKHLYSKYVLIEEKLQFYEHNKSNFNRTYFSFYKKCSVCGKLEYIAIPKDIQYDLEKTFNKNPSGFKYWHCSIYLEEAKYLEKNYPNEIEVIYLEK